ncbi:phosphoglycerate dehydrogenase [Candidatus Pseudothioglobus singularis]|jgi:D-3-phosphoglycerate dehydrogenase / 2-oxoglutarate reductase|nr:phosphoglycerate dehydrogenase [Candidatus Pseudothioglobus singularis]
MTKSKKILITTVPFGKNDRTPLDILESNNIYYLINPLDKKLTEDELISLVSDFDIIIAGTENISKKVIDKAKNLKMISRVGIGLDSVDLLAAKKNDIVVSYTPDAPAPAVTDLTMGLMYSLLRNIHKANIQLHQNKWQRYFGNRLINCCIGIIGAGRVGSNVIRNLKALGCNKIYYYDKKVRLKVEDGEHVVFKSKEEIYNISDIISFHLPLDEETKNMITIKEMNLMKKNALLINTSRGGIINEDDLNTALKDKLIMGAAIDVFEQEPYSGKLMEHDNCILTAHMGSMSFDCRARMEIEAVEEVIRFITGKKLVGEVPEEEYDVQRKRL